MSKLIIIPARFASTRYPGKPLVGLKGATGVSKPLIQRSWEAACAVNGVDRVVVATDDDRIKQFAESIGAQVVMTAQSCENGTERCADALSVMQQNFDVVVNLQGDAPLTPPGFVEKLIEALENAPQFGVATPVLQTSGEALGHLLQDRRENRVGGTTAVFGHNHAALYFSKEVIPYTGRKYDSHDVSPVYHHVGVYAYRPDALVRYMALKSGPLEQLEGLEQLRFLENNIPVLCVKVDAAGREFWELNNPQDVPKIEAMLAKSGIE